VDPSLLLIRGQPVEAPNGIFVMLHKPSGHVCSKDEGEGPTVYDLLPGSWQNRNPSPSSVGRLDKDTTGLLLITDDGLLQHRLTAPSGHTVKIYEAELENEPGPEVEEAFASGLQLRGETKPCLPARLERLGGNRARIHLTEGRYHQVRRMFAACGHHVTALHRVAFGPWHLGDLPCGSWRFCESNPGPNPVSSPTPPSPAP
jgi:16S rRNA pseudouridine516 synthase